jgi:PEP-CTERM motif
MPKIALAVGSALMLSAMLIAPASAANLFQPNFNSENGGNGQLNYTGFQNFTVSSGTVDLIGNGFFDFGSDNNLYVDMAGSTDQYGALTTKASFGPGAYEITLDIGGPISDAYHADGVTVSWTGCGGSCVNTGDIAALTEEVLTFKVDLTTATQFTIADLGDSGNPDVGATLFGFDVQEVPEPMSLALLGSGLLGASFFGRRKKKSR